MATTVQDIVTAGYAMSTKNRPGTLATDSTELLNLFVRVFRQKYALAARVNPTFFGTIATVAWNGSTGWARPAGAESVFRICLNGNTEVVTVPYDDKAVDYLTPSVYALGGIYRPAGNPNDPGAADSLTIYYSIRPATVTALSDTIDATWPEQFNELLALDIAIYLARKDGRNDEVTILGTQHEEWLRLFVAFLEHETLQTRRRFGKRKDTAADTQVPLSALIDPRADLNAGNG